MKLFKSLLVAPATLGLLAPLSAVANEVNLNDISNYSKSKSVLSANDFDLNATNDSVLISGGEGLVETSADSFSSTTTASFGSTFYVGSVDAGTNNGATTFSYDFALDLNTSFTGEDSLDVAIIGGNAMGALSAVDAYMDGSSTADVLTLDGIAYTFPLGGFTVTAGDGVGVDDLNTGACAYSAFTDLLSDCGTSAIGGQADSAVAMSYDFGNGFTIAAGIGGGGQSAATSVVTEDLTAQGTVAGADIVKAIKLTGAIGGITTTAGTLAIAGDTTIVGGIATADVVTVSLAIAPTTTATTAAAPLGLVSNEDASTLGLELAYTADSYGLAFAYTDDDAGGVEGTYYSFQAAFTPDAPYSVSAGVEFDDADASSYFLGVTSEVGAGSLSLGMSTKARAADHADNLQYEVAYSYDVNDGMTITPGAFIAENAGATEDEFGVIVTTSFSF